MSRPEIVAEIRQVCAHFHFDVTEVKEEKNPGAYAQVSVTAILDGSVKLSVDYCPGADFRSWQVHVDPWVSEYGYQDLQGLVEKALRNFLFACVKKTALLRAVLP